MAAVGEVTLQGKLPFKAEIKLIKDGECIKEVHGDTIAHITNDSGVFRIEAYKRYLGKLRGWIFSNPIYIERIK